MSAQINLFDPRFLKKRDPLSLANVVIASVAVYALVAAGGILANQMERQKKAAAAATEKQLTTLREQLAATANIAGQRAPNPQLVAELAAAEAALRRRRDIVQQLDRSDGAATEGFAEYFRGLARQVPDGLWLTGLTIESGGSDIEIRGKALEPTALPHYIRRLASEKAFQGRYFAALSMNRADAALPSGPSVAPGTTQARATAVVPAAAMAPGASQQTRPKVVEFVLTHKLGVEGDARQ